MSLESDIEVDELKRELENQQKARKKRWSLHAWPIAAVIALVVFVAPQVVFIEHVKASFRESGVQHVHIMDAYVDIRNHEQVTADQVRNRFNELRSEKPDTASHAMFFWLQAIYMESLEAPDDRQNIIDDAFDSLMPAQFNEFLIQAVTDDEKEFSVSGLVFDAQACVNELVSRRSEIKEAAYDGWNPFGVFWYTNEIGFPGWGVDYCEEMTSDM